MTEYNVNFRKVIANKESQVYANVSDDNKHLVETVEIIRSEIVERSRATNAGLDGIQNGHFMEIEFLAGDDSIQGVVFLTPYLPDTFVAMLREILQDVGIEYVL